MQKKIIALAIAGLASTAAFAQSNVTIYGRADMGYVSRSGDNGAVAAGVERRNEFVSGVGAGSRIGFRGTEDLGNGLKAIFEYEFGTAIESGTNAAATWGNRHSWIGLTGNFGTVVGGKLDGVRYGIFNKYDAFGGGYSGNFTQMTAQVDRASNAVAYISPKFMGGFDVTLAYATHIGGANPLGLGVNEGSAAVGGNAPGTNGNDGDAGLNTIRLAYGNGPISVDLDWERVSFKSNGTGTAAAVDDVTVYTIAGSYDFGMVKVAALYDNLQIDGRAGAGTVSDVDSWFISATIPYGNFVGKVTYGETEDDKVSGSKADKWGIGAHYNLSKRTNVYANYGSIDNGRASAILMTPAANGFGATSAYGVKGFDIGIAHNF
jgi:predicted porin